VVDWPFVKSLEVLLQQGVEVHIGYGIDKADGDGKKNAANEKPAITAGAEKDLKALAAKFRNFHFVHVGNTHRKSLVCDNEFAVVTSFNWLSYKGDSRGKPRDEHGIVFRKKTHVDKVANDVLDLLRKGYSGTAGTGRAAPRGR
jgi:phosphatidylserine/phosphatidylglycerophosphate/cardiolipin synthase-like enzyme